MTTQRKIRVLFVCTGNICRSPMAEAVFQHLVNEAGLTDRFDIASAAMTSWEVGEKIHPGTMAVLRGHRVDFRTEKRARQITLDDFDSYDFVVPMDEINLREMAQIGKTAPRLLEFAESSTVLNVPDPYYDHNFERSYQLIKTGCQALLRKIREQEKF